MSDWQHRNHPPWDGQRPNWGQGPNSWQQAREAQLEQQEIQMAGIGGLFNALSGALTSNNLTNAITAASALQGALGSSVATVQQAQIYLNQYQMAQASNNPQSIPMMTAAVAGLTQMIGALPSGDGPLIAELGNPAIMSNPGQAADVISRIQSSLVQHNFL